MGGCRPWSLRFDIGKMVVIASLPSLAVLLDYHLSHSNLSFSFTGILQGQLIYNYSYCLKIKDYDLFTSKVHARTARNDNIMASLCNIHKVYSAK